MVAFSNGGPPTLASQLSSMALGAYYVNFCWDPRQTLTNIFPLDYWHQGEYNLKELAIQWQHNSGRLRQKNICENDIHPQICRTGWMQDRTEVEQIRCRTGQIQDRTDAGQG